MKYLHLIGGLVAVVAIVFSWLPSRTIEIPRVPVIIEAEVTMYSPTASQTDNEPMMAASGPVKQGMIACPEWLEFGTRVKVLLTDDIYRCGDRMAKRYRDGNYFDILTFDHSEAIEFGRQQLRLEIL